MVEHNLKSKDRVRISVNSLKTGYLKRRQTDFCYFFKDWLLEKETNLFRYLKSGPKIQCIKGLLFLSPLTYQILEQDFVFNRICSYCSSDLLNLKTWQKMGYQYCKITSKFISVYRIVVSISPSHIEARAGLFRSLMKGFFDPYVLWPFDKVYFLISNAC